MRPIRPGAGGLRSCPGTIDVDAIDASFGVRSLGDTARGPLNALILRKEYSGNEGSLVSPPRRHGIGLSVSGSAGARGQLVSAGTVRRRRALVCRRPARFQASLSRDPDRLDL